MDPKSNNIRYWAKQSALGNLRYVNLRLRSKGIKARERKRLLQTKKTLEEIITNLSKR